MRFSPARVLRALTRPISRRLPVRRDDSGLTTLEWLLIVAAVAGLAALAVVLVTNVVSDTSEQIEGQSARRTAVVVAAAAIVRDADRDAADQPRGVKTYEEWREHYTDKCELLELVYSDIEVDPVATFTNNNVSGSRTEDADDVMAADIETSGPEDPAPMQAATGHSAVAHCGV